MAIVALHNCALFSRLSVRATKKKRHWFICDLNFDSKLNSDKKIESSNQWAKKYYDQYLAEGDLEQAKLFEPRTGRNCNPADFELRDFGKIINQSIPNHWETKRTAVVGPNLNPR